jgi:protocatechuate 3,4-dioxygenase beta subunit
MNKPTRRIFLNQSACGLAAGGILGGLVLRVDARPTPNSTDASEAEKVLLELGPPPPATLMKDGSIKPTHDTALGPFHRPGAPFRAKVCPPFEPGAPLLVSGRVWAADTRRPLAGVLIELWHVDVRGKYSAGNGDFKNRVRLITSETGYYEFETIHPVAYEPSPGFWRSAHIHFIAQKAGYKRIVSEMFFKGDSKHDVDPLFDPALETSIEKKRINDNDVEVAVFDIVLEPEKSAPAR